MSKIKNLTIYSEKVFSTKNILVVSDIHRTNKEGYDTGLRNLSRLFNDLSNGIQRGMYPKIDAILVPGDLVDDTKELENKEFRMMIEEELAFMTKGMPTYISLGNHDQMTVGANNEWIKGDTSALREVISSAPNTILLEDDKIANFEEIAIGAFSPRYEYYEVDRERVEEFRSIFDREIRPQFDSSRYNILMTHTPTGIMALSSLEGKCIESKADLVVSGHMHNGVIKLSKNRGLISPQMELFPEYAHGTSKIGETLFLINGPVNTNVGMPIVNKFFKPNANILTLKPKVR